MLVVPDQHSQGWVDTLRFIDEKMPYRKECFYQALSPDSMYQSGLMFDILRNHNIVMDKVNLYAPGFTLNHTRFLQELGAQKIRIYDYDKEVIECNWRLNAHLNIDVECHTLDLTYDTAWIDTDADLVINLSCENMWHMRTDIDIYSKDTTFYFQGTNLQKKGNINISQGIDAFHLSTGIENIIHSQTYTTDGYERYSILGTQ